MNLHLVLSTLALAFACSVPAGAQPQEVERPFGGEIGRMDTAALAKVTGRADIAMDIRAQNTATVSHNSVSGVSETGTISFDAGAFQSLAGLSLLSANTGNNVSINSSLNVNVSIQPQ